SSIFFFSSRRRHTRLQGDWSSDVCFSDLEPGPTAGDLTDLRHNEELIGHVVRTKNETKPLYVSVGNHIDLASAVKWTLASCQGRSEERRVGKEGRVMCGRGRGENRVAVAQ